MSSEPVREGNHRLVLFGSTWDWSDVHWRLPLLEATAVAAFVTAAIAAGLGRYAFPIGMTAAFVGLIGGSQPSHRQGRSMVLGALFMTGSAALGAFMIRANSMIGEMQQQQQLPLANVEDKWNGRRGGGGGAAATVV